MLDGMTNIKASEVLKELKMYSEDLSHYSPDEVAEALEMASKALEQQPCEDAISREAVLDLATTIETDDYSGNETLEVVEVKEIKELPSVIPSYNSVKSELKPCEDCVSRDEIIAWRELPQSYTESEE